MESSSWILPHGTCPVSVGNYYRRSVTFSRGEMSRGLEMNRSNVPYQKCLGPGLFVKNDSAIFNYVFMSVYGCVLVNTGAHRGQRS